MQYFFRPAVVLGLAIVVYFIYLPGTGGGFFYDDYANLNDLARIGQEMSASEFVFGGDAGPLGRPLSLLSFVPHATGWPNNGAAILHVNVLIHVANMLLLFAITTLLLSRFAPRDETRSFRVALSAALLWGVMPLLVSTSLIAIQRMTGLAALFGLLGLLGFVWGYRFAQRSPATAVMIQLGCLGTGTLLAAFAKENGVLIPIFALLIDLLLVRSIDYDRRHRLVLRGVLIACAAVPLYFISPLNRNWFVFNEYRGFSAWERFQTQWVILWEYLAKGFLPQRPTAFGPFQDHYGLVQEAWKRWLALSAWVIAIGGAFALRRYSVLPLFALLWYLAGHLLESTTITLEMVFEHRNYLAVYGLCLMLVWFAWNATGNLRRLGPVLLGAYIALLGVITFSITSLWGQPERAAEVWADKNPGSARAALNVAHIEGRRLEQQPDALADGQLRYRKALIVLDRTSRVCPGCLDVKIQALLYSCRLTPADDTRTRFADLHERAPRQKLNITIVDAFFPLHRLVEADACPPLGFDDIAALATRFLENDRAESRMYGPRLHFVAAMSADSAGERKRLAGHLAAAERIDPRAVPVLQYQVYSAIEDGRFDDARAAIERRRPLAAAGRTLNAELLDELSREVERAQEEAT